MYGTLYFCFSPAGLSITNTTNTVSTLTVFMLTAASEVMLYPYPSFVFSREGAGTAQVRTGWQALALRLYLATQLQDEHLRTERLKMR